LRGWRSAVHIVQPETVIAWHRRGFGLFWDLEESKKFTALETGTWPSFAFQPSHR